MLAKAIQATWKTIWKTTPLTLATPEQPLRFLGVDILVQGSGFLLGQQADTEELLRLNEETPTALGKIPCPNDLVSFDAPLTDEAPTEETVRTAQWLTGRVLWLSQCAQTDLALLRVCLPS